LGLPPPFILPNVVISLAWNNTKCLDFYTTLFYSIEHCKLWFLSTISIGLLKSSQTYQNPIITHLILLLVHSRYLRKSIQTIKSSNFIDHSNFFAHVQTHKPIWHPSYITTLMVCPHLELMPLVRACKMYCIPTLNYLNKNDSNEHGCYF